MLQEALNNVARHAGASRVWVSLRKAGERIEFAVRDDGCGLDRGSAAGRSEAPRGLGLTSMHERVESSGGVLALTANGSRGTLLRAIWPWSVD